MNEEASDHYKQKNEWLNKNTPLAAIFFNNKCQLCSRPTNIKKGVIHHLKYTGNDYKKSFEKLIEDKAITWICKDCHKFEHLAYCPSEVNYKTKHSGYCTLCNSFSWYAWFKIGFGRAYANSRSINQFPLCDKCVEVLLKCHLIYIEEINDKFGSKEIKHFNNNRFSLSKKAILLVEEIDKKIKVGLFGDSGIKERWQKGDGNQLDLF